MAEVKPQIQCKSIENLYACIPTASLYVPIDYPIVIYQHLHARCTLVPFNRAVANNSAAS